MQNPDLPAGRRAVLKTLAALALPIPAFARPALARPVDTGPVRVPGAGPAVRRVGAVFLVDGWVLTADDLERLGLHAG